MDFKKVAGETVKKAVDEALDGRNIGQIARAAATKAVTETTHELDREKTNPPNSHDSSESESGDSELKRGVINLVLSFLGGLLSRLFKF